MLTVAGLNQYYGGSHTLRDIGFEVANGSCTALLGRNGVGKSTLLKCLMGVLRTRSGTVTLDGTDITRLAPHQRARLGLAYVPQGREIFPRLTVEENLLTGFATARSADGAIPDDIYEMFPVLRDMRRRRGGDLSGGQQQQLAIARALLA
jgi:urea transport system ATP-binding protein